VFGIGEVGECVDGLTCACVGPCADPQVADAPSTCVAGGTDSTSSSAAPTSQSDGPITAQYVLNGHYHTGMLNAAKLHLRKMFAHTLGVPVSKVSMTASSNSIKWVVTDTKDWNPILRSPQFSAKFMSFLRANQSVAQMLGMMGVQRVHCNLMRTKQDCWGYAYDPEAEFGEHLEEMEDLLVCTWNPIHKVCTVSNLGEAPEGSITAVYPTPGNVATTGATTGFTSTGSTTGFTGTGSTTGTTTTGTTTGMGSNSGSSPMVIPYGMEMEDFCPTLTPAQCKPPCVLRRGRCREMDRRLKMTPEEHSSTSHKVFSGKDVAIVVVGFILGASVAMGATLWKSRGVSMDNDVFIPLDERV